MARLLKIIDDYRSGNIDTFEVQRAIDVGLMSGEIDNEEYMNLMDMINDQISFIVQWYRCIRKGNAESSDPLRLGWIV